MDLPIINPYIVIYIKIDSTNVIVRTHDHIQFQFLIVRRKKEKEGRKDGEKERKAYIFYLQR